MDPQNQNPQNPPTPVNADEGGVPIASSGTVITPTNSMENPVNATPAAPMPAAPIQQPAAQLSPVPLPPPPPAAMPPAAPLPAAPAPSGPKRSKKPFIFIFILLLIIGAVAAFYFGYYANPKVIYGQALNNTGKGYNKLIDYVDAQSKLDSAGFTGSGSYTFKTADGTSTDGKVSLVGDHKNVDFNGDIGLGVTRIKGEVRVLDSGTATPDLYVKMTGVKGAGSLLGEPDLDAGLATLDGQWIVVDHTMLDNLSNNFTGTTAALKNAGSPTRDQVLDEMRALGKVNQDYLFSTSKDKGVLKIVKTQGSETIDGHKTIHYVVGWQKANVKKYITAQENALKTSKLNAWISASSYDESVSSAFKELQTSADGITDKDNFDIWVDKSQHMIYKVRVDGSDNPAKHFVDVGLDYKGGTSFPIFISGMSKSGSDATNFNLVTTVDTTSNKVGLKFALDEGGTSGGKMTADFTYQPTDKTVQIPKPVGAMQLADALSKLGLGDLLTEIQQGSAAASTDLQGQLLQ
jgi:hypothetical protein